MHYLSLRNARDIILQLYLKMVTNPNSIPETTSKMILFIYSDTINPPPTNRCPFPILSLCVSTPSLLLVTMIVS